MYNIRHLDCDICECCQKWIGRFLRNFGDHIGNYKMLQTRFFLNSYRRDMKISNSALTTVFYFLF